MQLIAFTGTPGTGKSTLAKEFSKRHSYLYIDLNKFAEKNKLFEGYDDEKKCNIVDTRKLNKELLASLSSVDAEGIVLDSHLSHFLSNSDVTAVVVVTCSDLIELKQRLESRGYSEQKVRENLDAEIFKVCLVEATDQGHKLVVVDTAGKSTKECVREIESKLS